MDKYDKYLSKQRAEGYQNLEDMRGAYEVLLKSDYCHVCSQRRVKRAANNSSAMEEFKLLWKEKH